ncbi:uncharacterized protein Z519_00850 [Cladophialophora bantiana CBS 173.52]|uniref:DUF788 domain protein n=1 Tax=Cladophialophora bantiana (strain ATCC 10958 / CBS 173.52 / CDC B-1940 / NIH 8579) TaxID=1442370 RepID=A0A0D2GLC3_CLAB1|nr:uncharacterized protein Z519_00850 [Cladophialophora bantiana CBS 173.52]KIW99187.1 hypothetical protein Z519_00850 [Cladophialophora bantiana CBS 173.52]
MAQKAAKSLATRNTARLRQTHLITLSIHSLFLLLKFTLRRSLSLWLYLPLSAPAFLLEVYLDILARPTYHANGDLKKAGEDLDAKGLTEFMWDIVYWTWINLILVMIVGNRGWWVYLIVPAYAVYCVVGAARGVKGMMGGLAGGGGEGDDVAQSKRQTKMEKRGGQKVKYR